jgi:hypothetical protein
VSSDLFSIFNGNPFVPAHFEPNTDFEPIPPGKYPVLIKSAELKDTKAGTGVYMKLALVVIEGPCKNRNLWDNINLSNPNQECVEIGRRHLADLCRAVGLVALKHEGELVGKVAVAHVKVQGDQNQIRTYSSSGPSSETPASPTVDAPPRATAKHSPTAPTEPTGQPVWMRNRQ